MRRYLVIVAIIAITVGIAGPTSALTRNQIISDGFNAAGNWTGLRPAFMTFTVSGGVFTSAHDSGATGNPARWSGTDFDSTADQYSVSKLVTIQGGGGTGIVQGSICRASGDTDGNRDYYFYRIIDSASSAGSASRTTQLGSVKNGTETVHASGAITWAPGDTVEIECTGSTTVIIEGFKNGTSTGHTYSDSSSALTAGRPGVMTDISSTGDDFVGGSLSADSAVSYPPIMF